MRAAVYSRVSTEDQGKEGTSLGSQLAACLEKAVELGYEVPEGLTFTETFSGLTLDRPQLSVMRAIVKNGEIDAVIAYSPDRLSRVGEDVLLLFKEFKLAGVKLVLVREQFEDSLTGKMLGFVFGWASEFEAAQIKERTRRGKRTKAQNGFLPQGTGLGLYGYRWDNVAKKRFPIEREAKVVQRIFDMIAQGNTRFRVATQLNDNRIPSKTGSKWHPLTIERIVTNAAYIGTTYFGRTESDGKHRRPVDKSKWFKLNDDITPAIIDERLFNRAQLVLKQSKELRRGRPQHEYLLTGHIKCGLCGSPLVGSCLQHKYRYYRCRATFPTSVRMATCNAGYIRSDDVEQAVWGEVRKIIEHPQVIMAEIRRKVSAQKKGNGHSVEKEIADANKKLGAFAKREEKLVSLFEFDSIARTELLERVDKLKAERQEWEKKLAQLTSIKAETVDLGSMENQAKEFCQRVKASLDNCSFINKRLALDVLQVQVIATPEHISIRMAVPLELTTIEHKREYEVAKGKRRRSCGHIIASAQPA